MLFIAVGAHDGGAGAKHALCGACPINQIQAPLNEGASQASLQPGGRCQPKPTFYKVL